MLEILAYFEVVEQEPLSVKVVARVNTPPPRLSHLIQFSILQTSSADESLTSINKRVPLTSREGEDNPNHRGLSSQNVLNV